MSMTWKGSSCGALTEASYFPYTTKGRANFPIVGEKIVTHTEKRLGTRARKGVYKGAGGGGGSGIGQQIQSGAQQSEAVYRFGRCAGAEGMEVATVQQTVSRAGVGNAPHRTFACKFSDSIL